MSGLQEPLHSMTAGPGPVANGLAVACPSGVPEAWPRFHEEEKRRADAADGRAERLKREKVQAHRETRYWKAQWGRARNALEGARAEAKDLRGVSGDASHLRSEVDRLEILLADIGVDTRRRSTIVFLRIEAGRLQAESEALGKQLQEVGSERDDLRSRVETLSRAQFGRKSEQGRKTGPDHKGKTGKCGPRSGGKTHGRTPRPELARERKVHDPPPDGKYLRMRFRLSRVLGEVFMEAERELATVDDASPQAKVLRSLLRHRRGLSRVLDDPRVPLDNNLAERSFRPEVTRRKLSLGSDSKAGAQGMATMLTVVRTLEVNDIAVVPWLEAWLSACAANGGRPPEDLGPWLPWTMDKARRAEFRA